MIYQSQLMRLLCVRTIKSNTVNDVLVCRDLNSAAGTLYTVLAVKEHETVKLSLEAFRMSQTQVQDVCVHSFSDHGIFCMVFAYKPERALSDFYTGKFYTLQECEAICVQVIMACLTSGLPYPFLYLILDQGLLNLSRDHTIYLGYQMDLMELDPQKTERDCAVRCAQILRRLLSPWASGKAFSYRLLEKKITRRSYSTFMELYKDIRVTAAPEKKKNPIQRVKAWFLKRQDLVFRILMYFCVVLSVAVLASLITQLIFGDVPWLRLLFNGFKTIGTESLTG